MGNLIFQYENIKVIFSNSITYGDYSYVYVLEFENLKTYVDVSTGLLYESVCKLIRNAFDEIEATYFLPVNYAIRECNTIYVDKIERVNGLIPLYTCKYEKIKELNSLRKYNGYNIMTNNNAYDKIEREIVKHLKNNDTYFKSVHENSKPVVSIDKDTNNIIKEYRSINEACLKNAYNTSNISACCNGKLPTAYGLIWKFKKDLE